MIDSLYGYGSAVRLRLLRAYGSVVRLRVQPARSYGQVSLSDVLVVQPCGVVRTGPVDQAGENRWSLMSRAAPITPAVGPNSPRTMGRLPVARGSDWR